MSPLLDVPTSLLAPPALREGDTIAVVAPAGPVPLERLKPALTKLAKQFKLIVADDIGRRDGFLAGDDQRRAEEFNAALANPEVRAIWAARGGYGCSRMVPLLDDDALRRDPVPIIGFSDLTVLLCWAARVGVRSIHGPVLTQLGEMGANDYRWAIDMVLGQSEGAILGEDLLADSSAAALEGRLIGGNLSLLSHLCGTSLAPDYRGSICIVEDVNERPYAIDRHIGQLLAQEGGIGLGAAAAVLLGDFTDCDEASDPEQRGIAVAGARLEGGGLLCGQGLLVGHGTRNRAFPFGAMARLEQGRLLLLEPAVQR